MFTQGTLHPVSTNFQQLAGGEGSRLEGGQRAPLKKEVEGRGPGQATGSPGVPSSGSLKQEVTS